MPALPEIPRDPDRITTGRASKATFVDGVRSD
jgi:hypothetical protein